MKRIHIFDFDGTLINTPLPEEGKRKYEELRGEKYPHKGWWGREESLLPEYEYPPVKEVHDAYHKAVEDGDIVILQTNRLPKLKSQIDRILKLHGIEFGYKFYGDGRSKSDRLVHAVNKALADSDLNVTELNELDEGVLEIIVWEDMDEHIRDFHTLHNRYPHVIITINHIKQDRQ